MKRFAIQGPDVAKGTRRLSREPGVNIMDLEWFQSQRSRLFGLAYRMLGSATDAEDVLQDAWLRIADETTAEIRSPEAWATTVVTRLCLDRLKSAHVRREAYVGPWLPEPVLTDDQSPATLAERAETVTLAFLVLLETLSAEERAVFLLKEIFEYEHSEIGRVLGLSPENSRQLLHRARTKVRDAQRPPFEGRSHHRDIAERFANAFQAGDTTRLAELLAADCTFVADGGGKAAAARRPFHGRDDVLKFLAGLHRAAAALGLASSSSMSIAEVNREPAVIVRVKRHLDSVFVLSIFGNAISQIRVVRNPDKLTYIDKQLQRRPDDVH
jgi:RNA polymerase sigma-70 factor (TIGR02957 family)